MHIMTRTCRVLALLLALFGVLVAPAHGRAATGITLIDDRGGVVHLSHPAMRIISLAPNTTEILFALGLGPRVVGVSSFTNYPRAAVGLPAVIDYYGVKSEKIVSLRPDLLVAAGINAQFLPKLRSLGIPVLVTDPSDIPGILRDIALVARAAGVSGAARALDASLQRRIDAVARTVGRAAGHPRVFYELDSSYYTAGHGSFMDSLIRLAGGINIAGAIPNAYPKISSEKIIVSDPELIVLGDAASGVTPAAVARRPGWGAISAVRTGRISPFNDDLSSRPGPRIVEGLEALARLVHPELYR